MNDGDVQTSGDAERTAGVSRRRVLQGTAIAGVFSLFETVGAETGAPTELVVRAADVDVPFLTADASVVDELKATAAKSQESIVEYADSTDGLAVKNRFWLANALLLEVDPSVVDLEALIALTGVSDVHPNVRFEIPSPKSDGTARETVDDTYGLEQIDARSAWDAYDTRGEGARIAVLDTGVDPAHPDIDLSPEHFAEFDGDGNQVDSDPHDSHYHGTHVSGTATGGDASGTAIGVAPEATLLGGLVLPDGSGTFAQIVGGMQWAVEAHADAINMSLGVTGYVGEFIEPVQNAERAGTVVVSSSGNSREGSSGSPANVYDAFAIGASNESEGIAEFSSGESIVTDTAWGRLAPDEWPNEYVVPDASAPGVDVLSAYPVDHADGPYYSISGTSMASPHVAGVVGLIRSAEPDSSTPDQVKRAITSTASKPDDAPSGRDTRYGDGIVDAYAAAGRFAADGGVEGTVTDADGVPISGASVTLDGFPAKTDADGRFRIPTVSGMYDLTANAFGYTPDTVEVEVGDSFTTVDFTLGDNLALGLLSGQPEGLQAGESFDVAFNVANVESLIVERTGEYVGDVWLDVDDEPAEFDESIEFDGVRSDEVTVTVHTGADGIGDLELAFTFVGLGDSITVTTGPTGVYEEPVPIGIVDAGSGYAADLEAMLAEGLAPRYQLVHLDPGEALTAAANREHEGYVVQDLGDDPDLVTDFVAEASTPAVGVVYLDQFGDASDAVSQVSDVTGDPRETYDAAVESPVPVTQPVDYAVTVAHPVFEGLADEGESLTIAEPDVVQASFSLFFSGFHTYFEEYSGGVAGSTVADTSLGFTDTGRGLAIDDLTREVHASSLGLGPLVDRSAITPVGVQLLGNLVEHAAATPPIAVEAPPAKRVAPGESVTLSVAVEDLVELEADVAGLEFLDEDALTLFVNDEKVQLGEPVAYDEFDGTVDITVQTTDRIGAFSIATRFVTLGRRDRAIETVATFRPTTVYESPIRVPDQLDDLQAAVDFVRPGDTVVLADGVYEVDEPDRGFQTGLYVGTPGITIRGEDGASPSIVHERDLPGPRIVHVGADDVTLENVEANVVDGTVDGKNSIGTGVLVGEGASDVTIRDVTAAGTFGVQLRDVTDVVVEDVGAIQTVVGVGTDSGFFGTVDGATIRSVTVTDSPDYSFVGGVVVNGATRVTVTDCYLEHESGDRASVRLFGPFDGGRDCYIANNTIVGPDEEPFGEDWNNGIYVDGVDVVIEDNRIVDAYTGIRVAEFGFGFDPAAAVIHDNAIENAEFGLRQFGDAVEFATNDVEATVGLDLGPGYFGLDADAVLARYNDLSDTDLPFRGEPDDGWGAPEGPFDCRQNYLGDRDYANPIVDGDVVYDPYLTVAPSTLDSIGDVDSMAPTEIATDLYLAPGNSYAIGVPGPTDQTIYDVLGVDGYGDFSGEIEVWNHNAGRWQRVTGEGDLQYLDTLYAFKVTPAVGVRAEVHFQRAGDPPVGPEGTPPGHRDSDLDGTTLLEDEWNFVPAPTYGDVGDVFDQDLVDTVRDEFDAPESQIGTGAASPFTGYLVSARTDGRLSSGLTSYDPTMVELYEGLGLDPAFHDEPGPTGTTAGLDVTLEDVLEADGDDSRAIERVTAFVIGKLAEQHLGGPVDAAFEDVSATAAATVDSAPAEHTDLVELATERAARQAGLNLLGATVPTDSEGPFDDKVVRSHAEEMDSPVVSESTTEASADD